MVLREVLSGLPMSVLFPFAIAFLPNMHIRSRVVNLGPVYTIPESGFPGILDL